MRKPTLMLLSLAAVAALVAGAAITPGAATVSFSTPVRVGGTGYEPGIDIADNGTIFVNEPSGQTARSSLFRSTDDGTTFQRAPFTSPHNRMPGGFDSDVAVVAHGSGCRVYFLDLWVASNTVTRSDDCGSTWTAGTPITTLALSDRQWIAVGKRDAAGRDTVFAVYALIQEPNQVMVARSRDSGETWSHHAVAPKLLDAKGFTGQLVADQSGFVAFSFEEQERLHVAYSHDEGETWSKSTVTPDHKQVFPGHIQGFAKSGNSLHVVWISRLFGYATYYARSDDLGATWSEPQRISDEGSNMFPWIDARGQKVAIAWYGANVAGPTDPNKVPSTNSWRVKYAESLDGGQTFTAPADAWTGTVKRGPICTMGLGCNLTGGGNRELGDFLQVAIGPDGKSAVVFGSVVTSPSGTVVAKQL